MTAELSASARRIQQVLDAHGMQLTVEELPASTRTAVEAAAAIGCDVAQIAKSLVFRGLTTDRLVLVVASGINRVDEARVAELVGEPIGKADADYVRARTGFAIGGVAPVGLSETPLTVLDEDLLALDEIWAAAGTPHAVFKLLPGQLVELTGATPVRVRV